MSSTSTIEAITGGSKPGRGPNAGPGALAAEVTLPESASYRFKKKLLGKPLVNEQLHGEKLSRPIALGVLAPDCVSSSAYGTEQILTQLIPYFGVAGFMIVMPITGVILGLLILLTLCYRDVVSHYTKAGGAYVVARENFGIRVAQVAAVALMIDYVVTVAVQIAAGTDAIASWLTFTYHINIDSWKIYISVGMILLLCYGNLRGIREAGRSFAVPAYFYIVMGGLTVATGLVKLATSGLPKSNSLHAAGSVLSDSTNPVHGTNNLLAFAAIAAILRGFANGGSSLTGLEAISNGVSVFRKPAGVNAKKTMFWMSAALGSLVLGVSTLAWQLHTTPFSSGNPTVLAQITQIVWGRGWFGGMMLTLVQLATALILYTGGNTSFNGFPFLASFVAEDSFLPRQFLHRGHRLAFSNGIIVLTVLSLILLIGTGGDLTALVSLYAIGVFTGFVMASAGLFKYHWIRHEKGKFVKLLINGSACVLSFAVVLIFATFKFTEGAWIVLVIFPPGVYGLIQLNKRYRRETEALAKAPASATLPTRTSTAVLVLVDSVDLAVVKALRYARSLRPTELRAVHLMIDNLHAERLRKSWDASQAADIPLEIIEVPDRRIRQASMELAAREASDGRTEVTVLLPRRTYSPIVGRLLHDRTADRIAEAVSKLPHVAATIVPFDVTDAIGELEAAERGKPARPIPASSGPRKTHKMLLDAECLDPTSAAATGDPTEVRPIGEVSWRQRTAVEGRVRSVFVSPVSGSPALECEIHDGSGGITVVFYGRRSIPGIEPGAKMRVEGMVGEMEGHLAMANPTYRLLPRDHQEE